jgi:DNA repair protein RadC
MLQRRRPRIIAMQTQQISLWATSPTDKKEIAKQRRQTARDARTVESTLSEMRMLHEKLNTLLYTATERPIINSPSDIAALVECEMENLDHEELVIIAMDRRNKVLQIIKLYKGSVSSSQVRIGEIFRDAIRLNASAICLIHNHPSGDPTPSPEDVQMTRAVVQAGKLLNIDVLDHVVIGRERFISLKERGLGF